MVTLLPLQKQIMLIQYLLGWKKDFVALNAKDFLAKRTQDFSIMLLKVTASDTI